MKANPKKLVSEMDGIVPLVYLGIVLGVFASAIVIFYSIFSFTIKRTSSDISKFLYMAIKANLVFNFILLPVVLIAAQTIIGYGPLPYIFCAVLAISILLFFIAKNKFKLNHKT